MTDEEYYRALARIQHKIENTPDEDLAPPPEPPSKRKFRDYLIEKGFPKWEANLMIDLAKDEEKFMSTPSVKQRIWQALRLRSSTTKQLCLVVDAPKPTIYTHLREWQTLGLVTATKVPNRTKNGPKPLVYALIDRSRIYPPVTERCVAANQIERQIWQALEQQPMTLNELASIGLATSKVNIYKILRNWRKLGSIATTRVPNGSTKPSLRYSTTLRGRAARS